MATSTAALNPTPQRGSAGTNTARNAVADAKARRIAADILAGTVPENDGRWQLVVIVEKDLAVIERIVTSYLGAPAGTGRHPLHEDCVSAMERIMRTRIVGEAGRPPTLDLAALAGGSSFAVWAWEFARAAVVRVKSTLQRRHREQPIPEIGDLLGVDGDSGSDPDGENRMRAEQLADEVADLLRYTRGHTRTHLQAIVLRRVYGLPAVPRRVDHPDRERLLQVVSDDPFAVRRALSGSDPEGLAELFVGWPEYGRQALIDLSPEVASAMATAALTPKSPLGETMEQRLRALVARRVAGERRAEVVYRSLLRVLSELDCSESHPHRRPQLLPAAEREAARCGWAKVVESLPSKERAAFGPPEEAAEELWVRCFLDRDNTAETKKRKTPVLRAAAGEKSSAA